MNMTTIEKTAASVSSGNFKNEAIVEDFASNSPVSSIQHLDTKHCIFISADTIFLGNQSKTFVEAIYMRNGVAKDVSTSLKPNPRYDTHLNSMEVLKVYAGLIPNVEVIYYSLPDLGSVGMVGNISAVKIGPEENPTVPLLANKIKGVIKELREENRGLYA